MRFKDLKEKKLVPRKIPFGDGKFLECMVAEPIPYFKLADLYDRFSNGKPDITLIKETCKLFSEIFFDVDGSEKSVKDCVYDLCLDYLEQSDNDLYPLMRLQDGYQ